MKEHGGGSELIKPISFLADLNHFLANFTPKVCILAGKNPPGEVNINWIEGNLSPKSNQIQRINLKKCFHSSPNPEAKENIIESSMHIHMK